MDMLGALQRSGGIEALARQAEVEPQQALVVAKEVLPGLLAAFRNLAGGRSALLALIEGNGGAGLAAAVMGVERANPEAGQAMLSQVLEQESADLSAAAARFGPRAARLLPLIAMLAGGYISAMAAGHGAGPQGLDALLGGPQ